MRTIIKTEQLIVKAWQLGRNTPAEQQLLREGKIRCSEPGRYEVFSQECHGESGQNAFTGDYFKIDTAGFPYPISQEYFEANHIHLADDEYQQSPKVMEAWLLGDPADEVLDFLLQHKGLEISPDHPDYCFRAPLWGSILTAASDAILVIYGVDRDAEDRIMDVDFNFVAKSQFDRTYRFITND